MARAKPSQQKKQGKAPAQVKQGRQAQEDAGTVALAAAPRSVMPDKEVDDQPVSMAGNDLVREEPEEDVASPKEETWASDADDDEEDSDGDDSDDDDDDEDRSEHKRRRLEAATSAIEKSVSDDVDAARKFDGLYRNKQRVLIFCSRGVTARYRHLMEDIRKLVPHHKKDVKFDAKGDLQMINEIAEGKSCNGCMFFEARKRQDLYMWVSKTPLGPSVKFHVLNVHTMDELRMTGNAMQSSRPLLSFDGAFDDPDRPHLQLIKAMLVDVFNCPRGHPKSKPFIDRIMSFCLADGKVWVRNYQILDDKVVDVKAEVRAARRGEESTSLVEIGPRFVLNPIRIFAGSFGGPTLFQNASFVSPNHVRAEKNRVIGGKTVSRMAAKQRAKEHRAEAADLPRTLDDDIFRTRAAQS